MNHKLDEKKPTLNYGEMRVLRKVLEQVESECESDMSSGIREVFEELFMVPYRKKMVERHFKNSCKEYKGAIALEQLFSRYNIKWPAHLHPSSIFQQLLEMQRNVKLSPQDIEMLREESIDLFAGDHF